MPCTDDQNWHTWGFKSDHLCSAVPDPATPRNGHPTMRFSAVNTDLNDRAYYDHGDRHIEKYLGTRIRLTAWLKCEGVTSRSGLSLQVNGPAFRQIANDGQAGRRPLLGTMDWKKYEAVADVPANAQSIFTGLLLNGKGTIWIDDVQTEVVDPAR